jgi:prepilin-type N-terminal cleavage/methylation domain-containing protein
MRKSMDEKDQGFTLIELLVVMIIIGILAAIAIPVFLSQRKKAQDSAAKADVSTLGKEIATYYVDGTGGGLNPSPAITTVSGRYLLNVAAIGSEGAITNQDLGKASNNVQLVNQFYTDGTAWCISVKNDQGDKAHSPLGMKYSAAGGLVVGAVCTDANG